MSVATTKDCVSEIGEVAGLVWHTLSSEDAMSPARLSRTVKAPRDVVMQAVGWLAREGKVSIEEKPRGRFISVR